MTHALIYSLAACAVSVALEAVFAGRGIKQRLTELRVPRYAPPLWAWIVIGAFYYVICFVVLYRLFAMPEASSLRRWALLLLGSMMFINALWNYFFFRTRNLFYAYVIGLPYSLIALVLFALLLHLNRTAAFCLLPYLFYLFYANTFGYSVWKPWRRRSLSSSGARGRAARWRSYWTCAASTGRRSHSCSAACQPWRACTCGRRWTIGSRARCSGAGDLTPPERYPPETTRDETSPCASLD